MFEFLHGLAPQTAQFLARFGLKQTDVLAHISAAAATLSKFLAGRMLELGQDAVRVILLSFVTLYVLFFFLRSGESVVDIVIRTLPLGTERVRLLVAKFSEVTRATVKGTLVVGLVHGFLIGLAFWALGIKTPVFWGVLMSFLSILPVVGTALVWLPAAIILLATGKTVKAMILVVFATVAVGIVENILRPILVGKDTQLPEALVLISTLGGVSLFGVSGFVIGPLIASFFLAVWAMFERDFGEEGPSPKSPDDG